MFGSDGFGDTGFGITPISFRSINEGIGTISAALTVDGDGARVFSGTGGISAALTLAALGARDQSGTGSINAALTLAAQGSIVSGSVGLLTGGPFDINGVMAFYEMPHDPVDYRIMTVGLRRYIWRPDLGRWRPAGGPRDPSIEFNFMNESLDIVLPDL